MARDGEYRKKYNNKESEIGPLEVVVDSPGDVSAVERAMRKLSRLIKKDGVFKEYMWRRHHREAREKKPKYFGK